MSDLVEQYADLWAKLEDQMELEMYADGNDRGANETRFAMLPLLKVMTWEEERQGREMGKERWNKIWKQRLQPPITPVKINIGFIGESPVCQGEFEATVAAATLRLQQDLEEARMWATEFKRIGAAIWTEDWDSDDIDKLFDKWPTLPEWLKDQQVSGSDRVDAP